ncbi:MAG: response regulator, partial [Polyangiaceae bacterium]
MSARILVVDDSPTIRKVVSTILEARGYSVRTVDDGDVALRALSEESFSLILLDFAMPTMNGL